MSSSLRLSDSPCEDRPEGALPTGTNRAAVDHGGVGPAGVGSLTSSTMFFGLAGG